MSIILGFFGDLFIVLMIEFFLYITGTLIIRLVTFGMKGKSLLSFNDYKMEKQKFGRKYSLAVFTGLLFYVAVTATILALA